MMNPTTEETLSRYLDGDLSAREAERLETRLALDADLRIELEALRSLRDAVASLANQMEPPAELDQMMIPLRRDVPRRVARPTVRWLGIAAALALGVTVAVEVARRSPGPSDETLAARRDQAALAAPTEIFALEPLPKSAVPPEDQLVGAADRLLASPLPEPMLDEPEAMQVIGPLEEDRFAGEERTSSPHSKKQRATREGGRSAEGSAARVDARRDRSPQQPAAAQMRAPKGELAAVQQERSLVLSAENGELVARLPLETLVAPLGAEFEIVVVGGFVSEARQIGEVDDISGKAAAALIGLQVPQVEDGNYRARITKETASPGQE